MLFTSIEGSKVEVCKTIGSSVARGPVSYSRKSAGPNVLKI
jgi:hypothetical protein